MSIEDAILTDNIDILKDIGANEQTDINFFIEIERNSLGRRSTRYSVSSRRQNLNDPNLKITPIMLAASMGRPKALQVLLSN